MANSNNWGEIYKSTWWGDKAWSANTLFIDSAPPGFGLNLLKASEDMNITRDWSQFLISVAANSTDEAAPDGTDTAEKLTFTDAPQSRIQQQIALEANTTYTFSVYAKVRTGTKAFRLRNVTLGQAQQFTADTSWGLNPDDGRYSFSFTTGATAITHTLSIQNAAAAGTGEVFFWGAMLNEGATAGDYVKTEASVGGSAPAPAYSGFGDAFGGVTAYYSLRQFTEAETLNAIRVRRSSDDTEQDIGFDANGDLDTTALTTFVNEDYNAYTSDFSSTEDLTETNGTGAAAQSVGGVDDAYKFTTITGTGQMFASVSPFSGKGGGNEFRLQCDVYLPSTNAEIDKVRLWTGYGAETFAEVTTTDAWTSIDQTLTITSGSLLRFQAVDGTDITPTTTEANVFYLKNIVITQTTADGAVTTFYDQSGNGNDATNSTESEQPLVVSAGTLVEENGKAAIEFTDGSHYLQSGTLSGFGNIYTVAMANNLSDAFYAYGLTTTSQHNSLRNNGSTTFLRGTSDISFSQSLPTGQALWFAVQDTTSSVHIDGVSKVSGSNGSSSVDKITLSSRDGSIDGGNVMQEFILFDSNQSSNRTGMETNINDHFDIYS
jgi:hypothetical protein